MITFKNGKSSLLAVVLAIITATILFEVDPKVYQIEETAIYVQNSEFIFDYLTDPRHITGVSFSNIVV